MSNSEAHIVAHDYMQHHARKLLASRWIRWRCYGWQALTLVALIWLGGTSVVVAADYEYIKVAAGSEFSLALRSDGLVFGAGSNQFGELGIGVNTTSQTSTVYVPVQVSKLDRVVDVVAGCSHALALTEDGGVFAWGLNDSGQIGNASTSNALAPTGVKFPTGTVVTQIAAGCKHSLAIDSFGNVWAWGANGQGQTGNNSTSSTTKSPVKLSIVAQAIAGGGEFSLALKSDGSVWTWGSNSRGQLATGSLSPSLSRVPVKSKLVGISAIAGGTLHGIAASSSKVFAWGDNTYCQLGQGTSTSTASPTPVEVPVLHSYNGFSAVFAGYYSSAVVYEDGWQPIFGTDLQAWGKNESSMLGTGTSSASICSPTHLTYAAAAGQDNRQVGIGLRHTIVATGPRTCGSNSRGQLISGSTTSVTLHAATMLP